MTITTHIDLRPQMCSVRNQGKRNTCLAFTLSELNRFHGNGADPLSPEYLFSSAARITVGWRPGEGIPLDPGLTVTATPGQPLDAHCPYGAMDPSIPIAPPPAYSPMHSNGFSTKAYSPSDIWTEVAAGNPVGLGILLTPDFYDLVDALVPTSNFALPDSRHAVLVVGLGTHAVNQERHFLIRNSWGSNWGVDGHAWISETYINVHAVCAFGG